jgi:hypothetical protein
MRVVLVSLAVLAFCVAACGGDAAAPDAALPDGGPPPIAFTPPWNPHLADSTWPVFHRDSYAQHSSDQPGVTGAGAVQIDEVPLSGIPIFTLFDPAGDIFAVTKAVTGARLWKIDRATLMPVASIDLVSTGDTFAGAYGYLDDQGRPVVGVGHSITRYLAGASAFTVDATRDLSAQLAPGESLVAITVLYSGEIAFVGDAGTVGVVASTLDADPFMTVPLGEKVSNGLTTDETGGIFVVTSAALYRFDWDAQAHTLAPGWQVPVDAPFATPRPGRLGTGSGTTPALMMDDMVVITDDAESMNLMVVRRKLDTGGAERIACKLPVFDGPATTDNAIVVAGRTMIIEQNLTGYAGVARYDVEPDGTCKRIWVADVNAPSCVPTLSTASNLVYVFTHDDHGWGLTGLDLSTGRRVFTASPGAEGVYDNYYAAVTIGPDQQMFIGTIAGLLVFRDQP